MLLKKQVRGGVLLYALFMAGIFTLLLHVYLERVVASSRQNQAQIISSQSRLMAEMTMDLADKEAGAFSFSQGTTTYEVKDKQVIVRVASKGQIKTWLLDSEVRLIFEKQMLTVEATNQCFSM